MSHLLFKLNGVPEDEANDVRELLAETEVDFYETNSGRFGLGYAAIWTRDAESVKSAKEAIQEYQEERYRRVRSEHNSIEQAGQQISRLDFFMQSPVKFSVLVIFAGLLAYFTVSPFFG